MKTTTAFRRLAAALILLAGVALPGRAHAVFVFDVAEVGPNVVVTGTGTIDFTDLTFNTGPQAVGQPILFPKFSVIGGGPVGGALADLYNGSFSGPSSFGTGAFSPASSGSGDIVEFSLTGQGIFVPKGYVSGTPLSDSDTFAMATFSSLGVTPGTYTYTWGSGLDADSLILNIGVAGVPEPSTWALLGAGIAGLGGMTLRRRARRA